MVQAVVPELDRRYRMEARSGPVAVQRGRYGYRTQFVLFGKRFGRAADCHEGHPSSSDLWPRHTVRSATNSAGAGRCEFRLIEALVVEVDGVKYRAPVGFADGRGLDPAVLPVARAEDWSARTTARIVHDDGLPGRAGCVLHDAARLPRRHAKWLNRGVSRQWADRAFLALMVDGWHRGDHAPGWRIGPCGCNGRRAFRGGKA